MVSIPARLTRAAQAVALCCLLVISTACDSTTAQEHLVRAAASYEAQEFRTAVIELKNALQKEPDLAQARLLLAQSHWVLGDYPGALKEYERALDLGLDDDTVQLGLLNSKNRLGRYQEVIGALADTGSLSPEFAIALADAYSLAGDLGRAKPLYQQGLAFAGGNLGLGTIAWAQGDSSRAASYLQKAVEIDPRNREAWLRLAEFELNERNFTAAEAGFLRVSELPGGLLPGKLGLSRVLLAQGRTEDAAVYVAELLQLSPKLFVAHYLDALIKYQLSDIEGAEAALREAQRDVPDYPPSLYLMGAVKFQQNQLSQAQDNLQRYLAIDDRNESAAKLLASVFLQQNDLNAALETLAPFLESTGDPQLLAMAGATQLRLGEAALATATFERAVALAPDAAPFRNQLALSLLSTGEDERARAELESAIEVDEGQFQSDYLLAMLRIRDGDYAGAQASVDALIAKSPENPLGYNLKGAVLLGLEDRQAAIAQFQRALDINPAYLPAATNLARLDAAAGDLQAARQRYLDVVAVDPASEGALLALADLAANASELDLAQGYLQQLIDVNPAALRGRIGLIRLYLSRNQLSLAQEQASAARALAPESIDVLLLQAEVDLRKGDVAAAREQAEALQNLLAERRNPARLLAMLGGLQVRVGQLTLARENLQAAFELSGDAAADATVRFATLRELARLDLRENQPGRARERLVLLEELDAENPQVRLLKGDLAQVEGEQEVAIGHYLALADAGVRDGVVRLSAVYFARNEPELAVARLDQWLAGHPDDLGAKVLRAEGLMRRSDKSSAISQYEEIVDADNPVILNNLAWLYMERGDERALATARRAYELAPDNPDIADTLGWILIQQGEAREALRYIRQSAQLNPRNATVQYHLGVAYLESGDRAAATSAFEEALELGEFPEKDAASKALADLAEAAGA